MAAFSALAESFVQTADLGGPVQRLMRGASVETSVKDLTEIDAYPGRLAAGTEVYATWLPTFPYHHLVSVCSRLARAGFRPIPHLAARRIADAASARDLLERLSGEAGVDQALVLAGDLDRPAGPYADAAALLASGLLERHGIVQVGLAAYPEGHPKIGDERLAAALQEKVALARKAGLQPYVVSQFCFDAQTILGWTERVRQTGLKLPIRIGLAGPASVRTLINYGMRCGVGASLRAVKSHGISLTRLLAQSGPDTVVAELAKTCAAEGDDAPRLHFFSFGGFARTAAWMSAAAQGSLDLAGGKFPAG